MAINILILICAISAVKVAPFEVTDRSQIQYSNVQTAFARGRANAAFKD